MTNNNSLTLSAVTNVSGPALDSSQINVSGFGAGTTIGQVTLSLNNWTETDGGSIDREIFLTYTPTGTSTIYSMQVANDFGGFNGLTSVTLVLSDAASGQFTGSANQTANSTVTSRPTSVNNAFYLQDPPSGSASANTNFAAPAGTATLASVFDGAGANGMWTLYAYDHSSPGDGAGSIASWSITVTTASASSTSTSVSPSTSETFESSNVIFTATVTDTQNSGTAVSSGTVTFTDLTAGTVLATGVGVNGSGQAQTTNSFATEGNHVIQAQYNGNSTFAPSSSTTSVFIDHTTSNPTASTYCNTGTNSINTTNGGAAGAAVFPQHIFISGTAGSVTGISLQIPNLQNVFLPDLNFLLVDPAGSKKFVALSGAGSSSQVTNGTNLTLADGFSTITSGGIVTGTYGPTDITATPAFGSGPAGPYSQPKSAGSATFATTFGGDSLNGTWSLYIYDKTGGDSSSVGGYCLAFTTSSEPSTATTLVSNPASNATTGEQVTFTATVTSNSTPVTQGTVTFEESGNIVSGPTALNGLGQATYQTSTLSEGIHNITAIYNGVAGSFNVSSSSVSIEVDTPTTNPSAGVYCNPGGITLTSSATAAPYPSRINVTNLAGTISAVTATLNSFSSTDMFQVSTLLEGPTASSLVLMLEAGNATTSVGPLNLTFSDAAAAFLPSTLPNSGPYVYKPTSSTATNNPFAAPAPLPDYSGPAGSGTLAASFAAINPNGYWRLFATENAETGSIGNWCLSFTENPPVLSISKSHTGSFTQGDTADTYTITVSNPSGPGSTGGTLTLTDTLPAGMSGVTMSQTGNTGGGTGSDWSCTAGTATCTRTTPMPAGESDTITLMVNVSYSAAVGTNAVTNSVSVSGGGAPTKTATDPTTINMGPGYVLTTSVSPAGVGTVTPNPTNSPRFTAGHYIPGTVVTLTATANTGYTFSGWSGSADLSSTSANPTTITMNSATENVTANFILANTPVTINTSPQGLLVSVDGGTAQAAPLSESWQVGSQHTIATTSPQGTGGTQYVFANWSDGGAISHAVTVSTGTPSYTATFNTQYQLTVSANPTAGGTATPTSGSYYASGTVVSLAATANTGYTFSSWTGPVANASAASTTVTMTAPESVTANFILANTSVTINTSPQGLLVSVDGGTAQAAPLTESWQIGSQHTIATTSPQGSAGTQYVFANWSDSGAISHTVTVSTATPSYTATFNTQYQLTVSANPTAGGTATPTSGSYYASGTVVSLAATANTGYTFSSWTGPVANASAASTTVTMTAPESVTANFILANTSVTINTSPQGLLVSVDGGTAQAAPLSESWQIGSQHTIATTSPQGSAGTQYVFANWSDGGPISHTVTVSTATPSYTATFNTQYQLTVSANPTAGGTATPTSGSYYASGTVVSLAATANSGYTFSSWTGPVANASAASTTVTMTAPESVTANFILANTPVTINTSPQGLLVSVDGGTAQAAPLSESWQIGSQHTIATTSPQGTGGTHYIFANWSDSGSISHTVTVSTATPSYTATFNTQYQLTVSANPTAGGTATPTSGSYYASGTVVSLVATANAGYTFSSWTGPVASANNASTTVTMTAPETVTANFALIPPASVTNVSSIAANGTYGLNSPAIPVVVTFSKPVFVTGTPALALNDGGTATYASGSGTVSLTFSYTIGAGQNTARLDEASTSALSLNGGAIVDGGGTEATATLPAPGTTGSLGANNQIAIDTNSPTVVSYSLDFGSQAYNLVGPVRATHLPWTVKAITVVFSKPIAAATVNSIAGVTATAFSGLGTTTLTWTINPLTDGTFSTSLAASGTNGITDADGNYLGGGTAFAENFSVLYGDFNGDGAVTAADMVGINAATKTTYNPLADLNGDGVVNTSDVLIDKNQQGATQQ